MNTRDFHPKRSINYRTNHDILFHIMIKLDVQHIILLWFAANNSNKYWKKKDNINNVLKNNSFWQENATCHLQTHQWFGVTNFKKLMLDRYEAYKIIENELNDSSYYGKSILYPFTGEYANLPGVSIKMIHDFLMKDDAEGLFHKILDIPNLLPLIRKDDYDNQAVQACVGPNILEKHLNFIGLFPCMMRFRATNCFDLFARTYIILYSSVTATANDISEMYRKEFVLNSLSADIDFQKYYISLSIKLQDHLSNPGISVSHALNAGYFDLLTSSFNSMNKERLNRLLDGCEQWKTPVSKSTLMMFCTESEYKNNLSETTMKTISMKIDDKNLSGNINELIKLRNTMLDTYDKWILELRDRETLQNRSQSSYGIRPK